MNKKDDPTAKITPKQLTFCTHYTTIGAETFGNGSKSALAAGYSKKTAAKQASRMLKKGHIRAAINYLHEDNLNRNGITVNSVLSDLEHIKVLSIEAGEFSTAKGCVELKGKYLQMFKDNYVVDVRKLDDLTEHERLERKRIAKLLTSPNVIGALEAADAGEALMLPAEVDHRAETEEIAAESGSSAPIIPSIESDGEYTPRCDDE